MDVYNMSKKNEKNNPPKLESLEKDKISDQGFLSIFDAREKKSVGATQKLIFKPLTQGLGFKDTVSSGVYTEEIDGKINTTNYMKKKFEADGGTLNIGDEESSHGDVHIDGEKLKLKTFVIRKTINISTHNKLIIKTLQFSRIEVENFLAI